MDAYRYLVVAVAVWWIANIIASLSSKSVMEDDNANNKNTKGWSPALQDMRWIELTFIQHMVGGVASVIWLKLVMKQPLWSGGASNAYVYIASLANVVGNTGTNAAYAAVSSCMTQVIKACEPLVTLLLAVFLYKNYEKISVDKVLSIVVMVVGASTLVMSDNSSNVVGLIAAIGSTVSFPVRNIFLKQLEFEHPLQKYALISVLGTVLLLPVLMLKYVITKELFVLRWTEGTIAAAFHFVYNTASVTVLQGVSPVTHSILNLIKRVVVVLTNVVYFRAPPMNLDVSLSLFVFFSGLGFHCIISNLKSMQRLLKYRFSAILGALVVLVLVFQARNQINPKGPSSTNSSSLFTISTSWVFEEPIPPEVVLNIKDLATQNPSVLVCVYCGTSKCIRSVELIDADNIEVKFLVIGDIVKDLPIETWLARHAFNKVIARREFEDHLHEAVRLGILWHNGGMYIDPTVKIVNGFNLIKHQREVSSEQWVSNGANSFKDDIPHILDAAFFLRGNPFVGHLAHNFMNAYPTEVTKEKPFKFNFHKLVMEIYSNTPAGQDVSQANLRMERIYSISTASRSLHFGTLTVDKRVEWGRGNANLGDEIQGFPGLQFLPYIDYYVERDNLKTSASEDNISVFFNAWWGSAWSSWPPPSNIQPIMTSVHVHADMQPVWKKSISYLEKHQPIGCRDHATLEFLQNINIQSFFTGCLTMMTNNPILSPDREKIYIVDVSKEYVMLLPQKVKDSAIVVGHSFIGKNAFDTMLRYTKAFQLLEMYGSAKVVITQRIHAALPCVGMGTPVVFINSAGMPGGEGTKASSSPRTTGLTELFHTVDMYKMNKSMAKEWLHNFSWDSVPPNPNGHLAMSLRTTQWNIIRQNQAMYDAAYKFGLIPLSHLSLEEANPLKFHIILPHPVKPDSRLLETRDRAYKSLSWNQWRCIESILHHHPLSKINVYSNTLPQYEFDVLTEVGYSVEVLPYNFEKMLKSSPARDFKDHLHIARRSRLWYTHERELLKAMILYEQGGIFLDTDMVIVRSMNTLALERNLLAWADPEKSSLNGAFMKFEKGHSFLEEYLKDYSKSYNPLDPQSIGNSVMTKLYNRLEEGTKVVAVKPYDAFYMFYNTTVSQKQCFEETSGEGFSRRMKIAHEDAYAVQVSLVAADKKIVHIKNGTICSYIFNKFCVLCNEL